MNAKPDEVKLVMVDPKKVELSMYNGIPHLLAPVVTDPKKASIALKNIVADKWNTLTDYLLDLKYKEIAGSLKDATIGVVSDKNILLVTKYERLNTNNIYKILA